MGRSTIRQDSGMCLRGLGIQFIIGGRKHAETSDEGNAIVIVVG